MLFMLFSTDYHWFFSDPSLNLILTLDPDPEVNLTILGAYSPNRWQLDRRKQFHQEAYRRQYKPRPSRFWELIPNDFSILNKTLYVIKTLYANQLINLMQYKCFLFDGNYDQSLSYNFWIGNHSATSTLL